MIVVDTSVWVDHFRDRETAIPELAESGSILLHSSVLGELMLGGLSRRHPAARELRRLPPAPLASPTEVAALIEWARLANTGIGYVDAHLLASARSLPEGRLLTLDASLQAQADRLGIGYPA